MDPRRILVDTNVVLEMVLSQERSGISAEFLSKNYAFQFSQFSLQSVYMVSNKYNVQDKILELFITKFMDTIGETLKLTDNEVRQIYKLTHTLNLDFDDAHIYFLANRENVKIATYDKDLLRFPEVARRVEEFL